MLQILSTLHILSAVSNTFPLLSISDGYQMIVFKFYVTQDSEWEFWEKYRDHLNDRNWKGELA